MPPKIQPRVKRVKNTDADQVIPSISPDLTCHETLAPSPMARAPSPLLFESLEVMYQRISGKTEKLKGVSLKEKLIEVSALERLKILDSVARELQKIHQQDFIHGNICEKNILVGKTLYVEFTDWEYASDIGMEAATGEKIFPHWSKDREVRKGKWVTAHIGQDLYSFAYLLKHLPYPPQTLYAELPESLQSWIDHNLSDYQRPQPLTIFIENIKKYLENHEAIKKKVKDALSSPLLDVHDLF